MKKLPIEYSIAKGYRLQPRTHKLITRISRKTRNNLDKVLWNACKEYIKKISTVE